jgi:15-cis-phytoene synthase
MPVTAEAPDPLPPEAELALAWSGPDLRAALSIALQLDRRLARIVGRTQELMLGQMRLAWWREALGKRVEDRPRGDAVLDGIGDHWQGREAALAQMVDGWEVLVTAQNLGPDEAEAFASGRGAFFAALASDSVFAPRLTAAGRRWALAEAAAGVTEPQEKSVLVAAGLAQKTPPGRIPRALGGLAVLESLARRGLLRGGRPLMEGRGASLAALRGAIFRA